MRHRLVLFVVSALAAGCAPVGLAAPRCQPIGAAIQLAPALEESSGAAFGLRDPSIIWTHNDDGNQLFALDPAGVVLARFTVRPRLRDWEDLAIGPCDLSGACLYLADTGDNLERRPDGNIRLVRIGEPSLPSEEEGETDPVIRGEVFPIRLPDGPRDIEAIAVFDEARIFLVSKGRNHPVTVYRYPGPLRPDTVEVVEVQRLSREAPALADQVTGGSVLPGTQLLALRTYQALEFFDLTPADTLAPRSGGAVNLRPLREAQGEAVGLGGEGRVVLTSEGGVFGGEPSLNLLQCTAESAAAARATGQSSGNR